MIVGHFKLAIDTDHDHLIIIRRATVPTTTKNRSITRTLRRAAVPVGVGGRSSGGDAMTARRIPQDDDAADLAEG